MSDSAAARELRQARVEGRALAAFNATGFEVILATGQAAAAAGRPVISQISPSVVRSYGYEVIVGWFGLVKQLTGARMLLHLDHCTDLGLIGGCIEAGWDSVMFDGSSLELEENIERTHQVVEMAAPRGVGVEAELGGILGVEDGTPESGCDPGWSVADIPAFVERTGAACLAIGFGNAHGRYESKTGLRWELLEEAGRSTDAPLVLHGGTGLTENELRRGIACGCAKINISTALKETYRSIVESPDVQSQIDCSPTILHLSLLRECRAICERYIRLFSETLER